MKAGESRFFCSCARIRQGEAWNSQKIRECGQIRPGVDKSRNVLIMNLLRLFLVEAGIENWEHPKVINTVKIKKIEYLVNFN